MMNKGYKGEIAIYTEKKEPEQEDCKNNCQICDSAKETNNKVTCKYVFFLEFIVRFQSKFSGGKRFKVNFLWSAGLILVAPVRAVLKVLHHIAT